MKVQFRKEREVEIVKMLSEGLTAAKIGEKINLTTRTTENLIAQIKYSYDAENTPHLVGIFFKRKILHP